MGAERKRGKLADLNRCCAAAWRRRVLHHRRRHAILADVKYVITLDTDTQLPRDAAREFVGHDGASAQPPALRRIRRRGSSAATASCSRAWASACRARTARAMRGSMAASRASIRTPARSRMSIRMCSAKARSSARASTTSMPSSKRSAASAREPHAQPRPARRLLRPCGPAERRAPVRGLPGPLSRRREQGAIAGSAATGRSPAGCFRRVPGRPATATGMRQAIRCRPVAVEARDNLRRSLVPAR
jgi:hypothetical protein